MVGFIEVVKNCFKLVVTRISSLKEVFELN